MSIVIETTKGIFTVDLYVEVRPKICRNFLKLCKVKYYNYSVFNSVQPQFIAQTGDPTGMGRGGECVYRRLYGEQARFFEGDTLPKIRHTKPGLISMVNCGQGNMFGSQFFITLAGSLDYLDDEHSVFGEIVEGFEILEKFNETICDGENRPYQDIRITHTVILDDPFEDPPGLEIPDMSPPPTKMLETTRIPADEDFDEYEGKTEEEIKEIMAEKEARARAKILEMVGDLPNTDCAPPENVLFVCKLNPVTTDEDLEIIFSRFGKVISCEIIRDRKTGDSMQYAFVEFDSPKACEQAYFKMDNVLIDDRRIHVDFSQSVAKYRWKGKGRLEVIGEKEPQEKKKQSKWKMREKSPHQKSPQKAVEELEHHARGRSSQNGERELEKRKNKARSKIPEKSRRRLPERRRNREKGDRSRARKRDRDRSENSRNKDRSPYFKSLEACRSRKRSPERRKRSYSRSRSRSVERRKKRKSSPESKNDRDRHHRRKDSSSPDSSPERRKKKKKQKKIFQFR